MPVPSGSTPVFGLPFPLETDIPDVATAIEQLALAVEGIIESVAVPIGGDINWWSDSALPTLGTWAYLHGQTLTGGVANFPALNALIVAGNKVGVISGANIVLKDTRNLVAVGAGGSYIAGATMGAATVTLATGNIPQFASVALSISDPSHNHGVTDPSHNHFSVNGFEPVVQTGSAKGLATPGDASAAYGTGPAATSSNPSGISVNFGTTGITGTVTFGNPSPTPISTLQPGIASHRIVRLA